MTIFHMLDDDRACARAYVRVGATQAAEPL